MTTSFELPTFPFKLHGFGQEQKGSPFIDLHPTVQSLAADELLIKVDASSINPMDPKLLQFNFFNLPYPLIVGFDFSGTVIALGGHEPADHEGQKFDVGSQVFGFSGGGRCFADHVVVKRTVLALRGALPALEAATYGVAFGTAYESIEVVGEVSKRAGQWVYVAGGSGGVGHFAVQIARMYGARVISSASKPEALALLKQLGVEHVLDYGKQDVAKELLAITGGKGVDLSFDPTSQPTPTSYRAAVAGTARGGRAVRLGARNPKDEEAQTIAKDRGVEETVGDWGRYINDPQFQAQTWKVRKGFEAAPAWYAEGKVKPHVSSTVPFEAKALKQALDDLGAGKGNVGKVVLKVR